MVRKIPFTTIVIGVKNTAIGEIGFHLKYNKNSWGFIANEHGG